MLRTQISPRAFDWSKKQLKRPKSDRLGEKRRSRLSFFQRHTIYDRKMMDCLVRNHHGTNGKQYLHPFWSQNRLVPCLLIDSHLSHGALPVLKSGTRTKGRPPYWISLLYGVNKTKRKQKRWDEIGQMGASCLNLLDLDHLPEKRRLRYKTNHQFFIEK